MPNNKVSYIMSEIWDTFTDDQKKIFGGQKGYGIQQTCLLLMIIKKDLF